MTSCLGTRPARVQRLCLAPPPGSQTGCSRSVTLLPTIAYLAAVVKPIGRAVDALAVASAGAARPPAS